mmetsp:Transcript_11101/g.12712  ORF Transcript_11101/g.12712 Transcript_11101/m.12712 type:complete len:175 (-) Transcript_11101:137-661(-)|eukprot:CAMPEP_0184022424 /NCGR_PEP_ID=MMETSP0954-20121128/10595_1 /TAXON_ID=627963 /ORGANISM="Aplanochytrium sp, Strain PBS07" /LENGTH=174 /DNA_ID=CAMNT_0026304791 /DNA_START=105 /DNA_END=629 /DNA_ORIENTATION=+
MMNTLRIASRGLRKVQSSRIHSSAVLRFAEEAAPAAATAKLNFNLPHKSIYSNEPVHTVIVPGLVGEYGITGTHQPVMSELKPGLVQVFKNEGDEPEKYFVSGGFALTHEDATTDVSVAEAVPLEELDASLAQSKYAEAKAQLDAATPDTAEHAQAQIAAETYEAMCLALGITV